MSRSTRRAARIGVLTPFTNTNLEADMALMRPEGVSFHYARLGGYDADEIPDAAQMAGLGVSDIEEPLRLLAGAAPDVVLYGCTSATLAIGSEFDREFAARVSQTMGAKTITAAGALTTALEALGAEKIAFASPYVPALNYEAIAFLAARGFETVSRADIPEALGNDGQGALTPDRVFALGLEADAPEADAIVLSCTDMRAVECAARLEAATGKPVATSNQALLFSALNALGLKTARAGFGALLDRLSAI